MLAVRAVNFTLQVLTKKLEGTKDISVNVADTSSETEQYKKVMLWLMLEWQVCVQLSGASWVVWDAESIF